MEVKWNILKLYQKSENLSEIDRNHQWIPEDIENLVIYPTKTIHKVHWTTMMVLVMNSFENKSTK